GAGQMPVDLVVLRGVQVLVRAREQRGRIGVAWTEHQPPEIVADVVVVADAFRRAAIFRALALAQGEGRHHAASALSAAQSEAKCGESAASVGYSNSSSGLSSMSSHCSRSMINATAVAESSPKRSSGTPGSTFASGILRIRDT